MTTPIEDIARRARAAALQLAATDTATRNRALEAVGERLLAARAAISAANDADRDEGAALVERGEMTPPLLKRLDFTGAKFDGGLAGLDDLRALPDPVGLETFAISLDDGLELRRVTCPIGVIGVIFESRPDAALQIAALSLKSANAVILKGGSEADRTNRAIVEAIRAGLADVPGVPEDAVQLIATREEVRDMLALDEWIDLVIPRGSNELVRSIQNSTRIPVLGHADGICSVYLDAAADPDTAVRVVLDAKTNYPAVCNAAETLLVHRDARARVLPAVAAALRDAGVQIRADADSREYFPGSVAAAPEDFDTEFLDLVLAVRTVESIDDAIEHINSHGSHHTDAIVTEDESAADAFLARVDSAGVYHNASTRFADGFRYGFGAEVGVSTNKTHARGPVGLEGLVIYKYHLRGRGHVAGDYGAGKRAFRHEPR